MTEYNCLYSTVQGDTLLNISSLYGVLVSELGVNNSDLLHDYTYSSLLPSNTRIRVPCNKNSNSMIPITSCSYIYQSGNDLNAVASVLRTEPSNLLYYGASPVIGGLVVASGCYNSSNGIYITKMGDTFDSIAIRFNIPVQSLISNNNIAGNTSTPLPAGQTLVIPT